MSLIQTAVLCFGLAALVFAPTLDGRLALGQVSRGDAWRRYLGDVTFIGALLIAFFAFGLPKVTAHNPEPVHLEGGTLLGK